MGDPSRPGADSSDRQELTETQRRLRESEQQYRVLVEASPDGIVVHRQGRIVFANRAALDLFGAADLESVLGSSVAERIHPDGREAILRRVAWAVAHQEPLAPLEEVLLRLDGSPLEVEVSGGILTLDPNPGVLLVIRPLTEQKRAQAEHRALMQRYRTLMETSLDGLHVFDAQGYVLEANQAFCRLLGRERSDVIGLPVWAWDAQWTKDELLARIARLIETPEQFETRFLQADGTIIDVEINAVGIPWEGRKVLYSSARDLSERRRVEAELAKNQRLDSLGLLAGGIAHDFNNILAGLQGQAELVRLGLQDGRLDDLPGRLDRMAAAFERGKALTRRLLTFSRGGEPVRVATPVEALLRETCELALVGSDLTAHFHLAEGLPPWDGDPHQIGQVFHNLLINARQASPAGAFLTIEAFAEGREVVTVIRDQGPGIPGTDLGRVFDPFFSTKKQGTGLGLTVAHSVVRRHGGRIELRTGASGGAEAWVWLPAAAATAPAAPGAAGGADLPLGLRVIVLEDHADLAAALAELLGHWGAEVRKADDGRTVLAWEEADRREGTPADLYLLDQLLPGGLGGLETARELRRRNPRAKILLMSGFFGEGAASEDDGFPRIAKPFTLEGLVAALVATLTAPARA